MKGQGVAGEERASHPEQVHYDFDKTKGRQGQEVGKQKVSSHVSVSPCPEPRLLLGWLSLLERRPHYCTGLEESLWEGRQ